MPLIEKIIQMQKQGFSDEEVIQTLKEEGVSPRDINEALDQSKVKSAVSESSEMEPSIMTAQQIPETIDSPIYPQTPAPPQQPQQMQHQMQSQMSAPEYSQLPAQPLTREAMQIPAPISMQPDESSPTTEYSYPEYADYSQPIDTELTAEIAEQIVDEKLQKLEKQISEIIGLKTELQGQISNVNDRLRRIEMIINQLQTSILGKIGEYGRNISDLKSEMSATQDSFSKILNPLTENIEELRKITGSTAKKTSKKTKAEKKAQKIRGRKTKSKDGFENYLRG